MASQSSAEQASKVNLHYKAGHAEQVEDFRKSVGQVRDHVEKLRRDKEREHHKAIYPDYGNFNKHREESNNLKKLLDVGKHGGSFESNPQFKNKREKHLFGPTKTPGQKKLTEKYVA